MDSAGDVRKIPVTRRAKVTPDLVGLPSGVRRRVAGLRREEAAMPAGVSAGYYVRGERGHVSAVPYDLLHVIARALQVDEVETTRVLDLVRADGRSRPGPHRSGPTAHQPTDPARVRLPAGDPGTIELRGHHR